VKQVEGNGYLIFLKHKNSSSDLVQIARESILYWCEFTHNKRKSVFKFGGDGNFENNNYIEPDLVSLRYDEVAPRQGNDERWIETGDHFGCGNLIERLTNDMNKHLPVNYLIEVGD
jgi:hypothetical protein